ncbi:MAG: 30S ribosomal protein S15 [Candidatus Micrarchaeaceae archaeon]
MARMHTRRHGKAKSRKPEMSTIAQEHDETKRKEVEELISNYFKQGFSPAHIGQLLKDKHGIKYVRPILGMRLNEYMIKNNMQRQLPADLLDLMRRAVRMRAHILRNHKDMHNKVRLVRVESKIWRLSKYYKQEGKLPKDWHYDPEQAALIIKVA